MDFRKVNYKPGRYLIGCGGRVHGAIQLHRVAAIESPRDWLRLRKHHKSLAKAPPYAPTTFVSRAYILEKFALSFPYHHQRGAVNVATFRP